MESKNNGFELDLNSTPQRIKELLSSFEEDQGGRNGKMKKKIMLNHYPIYGFESPEEVGKLILDVKYIVEKVYEDKQIPIPSGTLSVHPVPNSPKVVKFNPIALNIVLDYLDAS